MRLQNVGDRAASVRLAQSMIQPFVRIYNFQAPATSCTATGPDKPDQAGRLRLPQLALRGSAREGWWSLSWPSHADAA